MGKRRPLWAGEAEEPCWAQGVPKMLGSSVLDGLLYIYIFQRGLLLSLLRSLLAHSGERRDTCSQGEAAASEQRLALTLLLKSSPKSLGKVAGLMDHGWRMLAGSFAACGIQHKPGFAHPGPRPRVLSRKGSLPPGSPGAHGSAEAQRCGARPLCRLGKASPRRLAQHSAFPL